MATSCKELWMNKNFLLKFAVFVFLCILISFGHCYGYYNLVFGYEHSCLIIIISLMITYWLLDSTKFTELCLLVVSLIKLLAALIIDATRARADYSCEKPEALKKVAPPQLDVETRIMRQPVEELIVTTPANLLDNITEKATVAFVTVSSTLSTTESTEQPTDTTPKGLAGGVPGAPNSAASYVSYRYAAPPTDDSWDNTSENIQFYVHIILCVIAIILIAVDIFFRAKK